MLGRRANTVKIQCFELLTLQVTDEAVVTEGWSISPTAVPSATGRRYAGFNTAPQAADSCPAVRRCVNLHVELRIFCLTVPLFS